MIQLPHPPSPPPPLPGKINQLRVFVVRQKWSPCSIPPRERRLRAYLADGNESSGRFCFI